MSFAPIKRVLITLHRWIGLLLAPIFLIIIVTGAILSFKPVVADLNARANVGAQVDPAALTALVRKLEATGQAGGQSGARSGGPERGGAERGGEGGRSAAPAGSTQGAPQGAQTGGPAQGQPRGPMGGPGGPGGQPSGPVGTLAVVDGGRAVEITGSNPDIAGRWDVTSGQRVAPAASGPDIFRTAQQLHQSLLLGLNIVVEIASYAMLAIMIAGPFLAWLRFRNTLMGWHTAAGWLLLPITLTSPVTAVMLILHIGQGERPPMPRVERPVTIGQALAIAGRDVDLTELRSARRFRGGTVMVQVAGEKGGSFIVTDKGATPLTAGPSLVKQIHEGTWGGLWSGAFNFFISVVLFGFTVTGFWSWFARWRRNRAAPLARGADILVAHASQTGTATRLAAATHAALLAGGEKAALAPLGAVPAKDLAGFRLVLLVAATTGEGDVPDGARHLVKALKAGALKGTRFAVLGLGDRSYAKFCGGAETLRTALLAAGAAEAMPMFRADGDPAETWAAWTEALQVELDLNLAETGLAPSGVDADLVLAERRRMDDPAQGDTQETWSIVLESNRDLNFRPGDLVRLTPPDGGRPRAYSIGSSSRVDPRRIALTVRLHHWRDETGNENFGRVSGWLVREAAAGSSIAARVDAHPAFNPPADPTWPVVMIGAGSGIAPFPGFVAERQASGRAGPAWLFFGNRHRSGDFLWEQHFAKALSDGALTRIDTAFSRDAADGAHIQDRLKEHATEVLDWLMNRKAVIYVCGRRDMARGVEEALAGILVAAGGYAAEAARNEIARWLGEGRIRVDAFD